MKTIADNQITDGKIESFYKGPIFDVVLQRDQNISIFKSMQFGFAVIMISVGILIIIWALVTLVIGNL